MLQPGLSASCSRQVEPRHTAEAMGSGDLPVLATPALIALMEQAALQAVAPALPQEETTVGVRLDVRHLRATPVGGRITATATLERVEGRRLVFQLTAEDGQGSIGEGAHERVVVGRERFLAKVTGR